MPTILNKNGFRFFFYSNEHLPTQKFNLENVELVKSRGFNAQDLKVIRIIITENVEFFKEKWNKYFNN